MDQDAISNYDWQELQRKLESALPDVALHNLMHTLGDWESTYKVFGISQEGWDLINKLRHPIFERFQDKIFNLGSSATQINIALLARWLVVNAKKVGIEKTIKNLRDYLSEDKNSAYRITALPSLQIENTITLNENLYLTSEYPAGLGDTLFNLLRETNNLGYPYSFIVEKLDIPIIHDKNYFDNILDTKHIWEICNLLSLLTEHNAPAPLAHWILLSPNTPLASIIDGNKVWYPELKLSDHPEEVSNDQGNLLKSLSEKYKNIVKNKKNPIDVGLYRLVSAINTRNKTQKAIDLGISLECILTAPNTRDQLSLQFRTIGSLLTGNTLEERKQHYEVYKAIYSLRSQAVHNGEISQDEKISGRGKVSSYQVLNEGTALAKKAFISLINRGGLDNEGYVDLMLSNNHE